MTNRASGRRSITLRAVEHRDDAPADPAPLSAETIQAQQRRDLTRMRVDAMRHLSELDRAADEAEGDALVRLVGRSRGLVDAFRTLVQAALGIIGAERQIYGAPAAPGFNSIPEGEDLERRIAEELDRIAARRRAAGSAPVDRA